MRGIKNCLIVNGNVLSDFGEYLFCTKEELLIEKVMESERKKRWEKLVRNNKNLL